MNSNMLFISTCPSGEGSKAQMQHSEQQQDILVSEMDVNLASPLFQFNTLNLSARRYAFKGRSHRELLVLVPLS